MTGITTYVKRNVRGGGGGAGQGTYTTREQPRSLCRRYISPRRQPGAGAQLDAGEKLAAARPRGFG